MIDANSKFFALLTAVGEAKQVKSDAGLLTWKLTHMAVGDANGTDPIPDRSQKTLINERRRAPLNSLEPHPTNPGILVAEQIIPADEGGFWIRELGLFDSDGDLVAVANCAPSYKSLLAQGSGKTQVIRMNFVVSSSTNVVLLIDPAVVNATRKYVDDSVANAVNRLDFKHSALVATTGPVVLAGVQAIDGFAVPAGSRVLVKDQVQAKDNGLYLVSADSWVRTVDADTSDKVTPGLLVTVERGTANADTIWQLISDGPIVLGTTPLAFQWSAGQNVPTPPVDDRSKRSSNTESVRAQIESPKQVFPVHVFRKNRLINGAFQIWQRGKSGVVGKANGDPESTFGPDRWMIYSPKNATCNWSQLPLEQDANINEAKFALRLSRQGEGQGWNLSQRIENVETLAGGKVTVSFYMKTSVPHTCAVILRQNFGVNSTEPNVDVGTSVELTTVYKKYVVTLDLGGVVNKNKGVANDFLEVIFASWGTGAHYTDITNVQVESGSVATPYDYRTHQEEYRACLRYFEKSFLQDHPLKSNNGPSTCIATFTQSAAAQASQSALRMDFREVKRVVPTLKLFSPGDNSSEIWAQSSAKPCTSTNIQSLWATGFALSCLPPAGSIPGYTLQIEWTAEAEL
ncbi:Phage tail fiber protein [Pseudomonas sp. R2-37-08W]|uniref:phage tail protein n=1 Tax=Pseudomonas sp. R2-37-08W TaxID=1173273 RepID=UPI000F55A11A|nr:phage tail protein [Pseudomonas sp. R2-37-08W]AZF09412.1 Phage tail fiber protein [Pseudomonas sp. R2-37-08W]